MSEFFIYYKNNCSWCERAKELIENTGNTWVGLNIEDHPENLEEFLADFPGAKTVPKILDLDNFDTDGYIGDNSGYEDLVLYLRVQKA